jgi:hypothetical protein
MSGRAAGAKPFVPNDHGLARRRRLLLFAIN